MRSSRKILHSASNGEMLKLRDVGQVLLSVLEAYSKEWTGIGDLGKSVHSRNGSSIVHDCRFSNSECQDLSG